VPGPFPLTGRLRQVLSEMLSLLVLLDPLAQAWPFPQQRLVRDLDGGVAHRHQAVPCQPLQHPRRDSVPVHVELRDLRAAAGDGVALAGPDEPEEDHPSLLRFLVGKLCVGSFGEARHRAP
jgi:hypothetical protein